MTVLDILSVNDKDFSVSIMAFLGIQWPEPRLFKAKARANNNNKKNKSSNKGSRYRNNNSSRMVPVDPQFLEKVLD